MFLLTLILLGQKKIVKSINRGGQLLNDGLQLYQLRTAVTLF